MDKTEWEESESYALYHLAMRKKYQSLQEKINPTVTSFPILPLNLVTGVGCLYGLLFRREFSANPIAKRVALGVFGVAFAHQVITARVHFNERYHHNGWLEWKRINSYYCHRDSQEWIEAATDYPVPPLTDVVVIQKKQK